MRHQVTEKIGPLVNAAIDKHGDGEEILWEPQLMPGPNGEAMLVCFFWMAGSVIGSSMQGSFQILDPIRVSGHEIDDTVFRFLSEMRRARAEQAKGSLGDRFIAEGVSGDANPPQESQRGTRRPSGLLIP